MGSGCPAPCHVHIPVLSPLEGQGSCSSPGTGHCLQHPGTAVREFRHSLCWSWGWAASQRAQTLLGCCPCSEHTPAPALCFPKLWRRWQGFPYSLGCLQHTPEKNRSRASPQPAKKAPSGAPGTARSWHQAQAAPLQLLALWQNRGWGIFQHVPKVLVQIWGWRAQRGTSNNMTSQWQGGILGAGITQGPTAPSLHLLAAHKTHSPRATSSFPKPSADSHSCYLKIK